MKQKNLGKSTLEVSRIGYGTYKLGGYGWPGANLTMQHKLLEIAYEGGINFFDTAPIYGYGKSEALIGEVFLNQRDKIVIATKCGFYFENKQKAKKDLSYDSIMWSVEGSLKRMKTDYIDLLQIHYYDDKTPFNEVSRTLKKLRNEGVVKYFGVSNCSQAILKKASEQLKIITVQDEYSMMNRNVEENSLRFATEKDIAFIAYSPFVQGIFFENKHAIIHEKDVRNFHPFYNNKKKYDVCLAEVGKLEAPIRVMLNFLLEKPGVFPIFSTTNSEHLKENIKITNELLEEKR
ncbi:MAG: aldo/keto reductase [Fusobacteria bacterium]|nr:aldo/keto reductase [Fusobacteriota bacterium]